MLDNMSKRMCNIIGTPIAAHISNQANTEITVVCDYGALLYYMLEGEDIVP